MTRPTTIIARIAARISQRVIAFRNRRALLGLSGWDSHQLKDIGLTRSDIGNALSHPAGEDPAAVLTEIRDARRLHRRVAAIPLAPKTRARRETQKTRRDRPTTTAHPHAA